MKEICTLLVKLDIIFSVMQRVNQHARPSIIQGGVPPIVIRCVHRTMQMWVLQTWIKAQGLAIVMSDRNSWGCVNISDLARKIDPQVSEISLFAVLWFRIDQRLFISTVVPISIPGMSSSGYLPCVHWLWLNNTMQSEWREQAFLADDEWSGSSRCFYTSKWDGIATRFCPLQVENCTCMFIGGGNLPLHLRFWRLCMKWSIVKHNDIYFCERMPWDSFVLNFVILNDIFVQLGINHGTSLCKIDVIFPHFIIKMVQFYTVCSKMWIRFYK